MYGLPMTWGRCNRCSFSFFDHLECLKLPTLHQELFPCVRRQLGVFDSGVWAAQLSWWLHFYTPDDLFLTTTAALADPEKRMHVRPPTPADPRRTRASVCAIVCCDLEFDPAVLPQLFGSRVGTAGCRVGSDSVASLPGPPRLTNIGGPPPQHWREVQYWTQPVCQGAVRASACVAIVDAHSQPLC